MNPKKTKVMSVTDNDTDGNKIYTRQSPLEEVDNFSYFGTHVESDGSNSKII